MATAPLLSICVPTFDRPKYLENCLNSILISKKNSPNFPFEICISQNGEDKKTENVVNNFITKIPIKYNINLTNIGITKNIIKVVEMSSAKFAWIIGDDDLILPKTLQNLNDMFKNFDDVDYFFVNSYNLNYKYLEKFSHPFHTKELPNDMIKFSNVEKSFKSNVFWDIVDNKITFDYLMGIFYSIFNKKKWLDSIKYLNQKDISNIKWLSNFHNSCFPSILIVNSFKNSKVLYQSEPMSVNLYGLREWNHFYEFILAVRIPEILDYFHSKGMPSLKYLVCKNKSLDNFIPLIIKILFTYNGLKGREYLSIYKHILKNLFFPNVYFSLVRYCLNKLK